MDRGGGLAGGVVGVGWFVCIGYFVGRGHDSIFIAGFVMALIFSLL
jgi:hypothetical protein